MVSVFQIPINTISSEIESLEIDRIEQYNKFKEKGYDYIPIFRNNRFVGVLDTNSIEIDKLENQIKHDPETIINSNTSIDEALEILVQKKYLILINEHFQYTIITEADLLKSPFRLFLFEKINEFEEVITKIIKNYFENDFNIIEKKKLLSDKKLSDVYKRYNEQKKKNIYIDHFQCLDLIHKKDIIKKSELYKKMNIKITKKEFERDFNQINILRNDVVHNKDYIINRTPEKIISILKAIKEITT
ncbi:MAG: hypothetical protein ACOCUI_05235 [bacterium]